MADRPGIDFEAEGLLDGLEGEARDARLGLLRELEADGVGLDELREAVQQNRLALLPVERVLSGEGPRYTPRQVAEISRGRARPPPGALPGDGASPGRPGRAGAR